MSKFVLKRGQATDCKICSKPSNRSCYITILCRKENLPYSCCSTTIRIDKNYPAVQPEIYIRISCCNSFSLLTTVITGLIYGNRIPSNHVSSQKDIIIRGFPIKEVC